MSNFDATEEVKKLKQQTKVIRQKRLSKSSLDMYKGELVKMYDQGASVAELKRWLSEKNINVWWSTVNRWLITNGYKTEAKKD